ncbi:PaaI family thioesterase [Variovorax sp. J22P168]|uniref:PaaI family thioesterase n=1 Tax=Variovorax jilinensis TaxID=3053513 RepID=UPI00257592B8|nr:PaaI family thioesterase [Variovorax sp. J22P168]MDM0013245.1 PaaI family thioesterase [Variovorax sp. J22P168]
MAAPAQKATPEQFLAMGQEVLASQPFSVLVGAEMHALRPGFIELQLPIADKLKQQHGFAHGGAVSYLADNALTFAGGTAMGVPVVTAEFKINYLRPAVGARLVARARAVHVGRSQAVCTCEVLVLDGGEEKLCALAQGTVSRLPPAPDARAESNLNP